jgi:tellurite resistance protein TehA-like permease
LKMDKDTGRYAFLGGLLLSAIFGLTAATQLIWLVALLAIAVALLNIQAKETMKMLLWTIGMGIVGVAALASNLESIPEVGTALGGVVTNIGIFFMVIAAVFLLKIGYKMFER